MELAELLLSHFADPVSGGFYFTADDAETLMHRPKPLADEAMPSGNGVAAAALQRLGFLLGESRYLDAAEKTLRFAWQAMDEYPHGHVTLLTALEEYLNHPEIVVIRGATDEIDRWQASAAKLYAPRRLVFAIDAAAADLPGALAERKPVAGENRGLPLRRQPLLRAADELGGAGGRDQRADPGRDVALRPAARQRRSASVSPGFTRVMRVRNRGTPRTTGTCSSPRAPQATIAAASGRPPATMATETRAGRAGTPPRRRGMRRCGRRAAPAVHAARSRRRESPPRAGTG